MLRAAAALAALGAGGARAQPPGVLQQKPGTHDENCRMLRGGGSDQCSGPCQMLGFDDSCNCVKQPEGHACSDHWVMCTGTPQQCADACDVSHSGINTCKCTASGGCLATTPGAGIAMLTAPPMSRDELCRMQRGGGSDQCAGPCQMLGFDARCNCINQPEGNACTDHWTMCQGTPEQCAEACDATHSGINTCKCAASGGCVATTPGAGITPPPTTHDEMCQLRRGIAPGTGRHVCMGACQTTRIGVSLGFDADCNCKTKPAGDACADHFVMCGGTPDQCADACDHKHADVNTCQCTASGGCVATTPGAGMTAPPMTHEQHCQLVRGGGTDQCMAPCQMSAWGGSLGYDKDCKCKTKAAGEACSDPWVMCTGTPQECADACDSHHAGPNGCKCSAGGGCSATTPGGGIMLRGPDVTPSGATDATAACVPYSVAACKQAAQSNALQLGGGGYAFEGSYATDGCYYYKTGKYAGMAYYGGEESTVKPGALKSSQHRVPGFDCETTEGPGSDMPGDMTGGDMMGGDPFTKKDGKQTQFWLPLREVVPLLSCRGVALHGRVMRSRAAGDSQQWFDRFDVRAGESLVATIAAKDGGKLVQNGSTPGAAAADAVDIDASGGKKSGGRVVAPGAALSTLDVALNATMFPNAGAARPITSTDGAFAVRVAQDESLRIGAGFVERVDVRSQGLSIALSSAPATKFADAADQVRHMHLDVRFPEIDVDGCTGVLAEIWGARPMSATTAAMLVPPKGE